MRKAPNITLSTRPYDCTLIAQGWDTLEEAWSVFIYEETWKRLERAKESAYEKNLALGGGDQSYTTEFAGMDFQIKPFGANGVAFILSNDLYTLAIRTAKTDFNLSIKYSAACLWQYGVEKARDYIHDALMQELRPRSQRNENGENVGWQRVSVAHFAFDFHSPEFTTEMGFHLGNQIVCHSSSKARYDFKSKVDDDISGYIMGTSNRVQTLTIGNKSTLQIQIYDKGAEITEKSGKTWMYEVYKQNNFIAEDNKNIWRLEVRFGRKFFNEHNINDFDDLRANKDRLLNEALKTRRLVDPSKKDKNKRRWHVHPLWSQAIELCGDLSEMLPIGKRSEQSGQVAYEKAMLDMRAAAIRAMAIKTGGYDLLDSFQLFQEVERQIKDDPLLDEKMERSVEKYKYVNCAR